MVFCSHLSALVLYVSPGPNTQRSTPVPPLWKLLQVAGTTSENSGRPLATLASRLPAIGTMYLAQSACEPGFV